MDNNDVRELIPMGKAGNDRLSWNHVNKMAKAINQRRGTAAPPSQVAPVASGGVKPERFKIVSISGDYVTCNTWDGTTAGPDAIKIAKTPLLRNSLSARDDLTFTFPTTQTRIATDGSSNTENQEVTPMYLVDDELYATLCDSGVTDCDYLDDNRDARCWQKSL
jgi:hypothetical protein